MLGIGHWRFFGTRVHFLAALARVVEFCRVKFFCGYWCFDKRVCPITTTVFIQNVVNIFNVGVDVSWDPGEIPPINYHTLSF